MRRAAASQFLRFSLVGVVNTAIQVAMLAILTRTTDVHYLIASMIGYTAGLINSYAFNRRWTFRSARAVSTGEIGRFLVVNVMALVVNAGVLYLCVSAGDLRPEIAQLGAVMVSLCVNFVGNRIWTFSQPAAA